MYMENSGVSQKRGYLMIIFVRYVKLTREMFTSTAEVPVPLPASLRIIRHPLYSWP